MNKDAELFKMVETQMKRRYQSAQQEQIKQILSKKPHPVLNKEEEVRPFDEIKRQLETKIQHQNFALRKKQEQSVKIQRISFKLTKNIKELQIRSQNVVEKQRLLSGHSIKKSLRCLKNRDQLNIHLDPPTGNLIQQNQAVKLNDAFKNNQLKLFLKDSDVMMLLPEFEKRHKVQFKNSFLNQNDLQKRGQILAKLSLLQIFQSQVPMLQQKQRIQDLNRVQRSQMQSMKQEAEAQRKKQQKVYQNQNIPQSQLISQAKQILRLIEIKVNQQAKKAFEEKKYEVATNLKKQLQKIRKQFDSKLTGTQKLKYLIIYKCRSGL